MMGRRDELKAELDRIVKILIEEYKADKIILFGSMALDDEKDLPEWADIDLIVIKDTNKPFFDRLEEVVEIVKPDIAADIIVYTPKEMQEFEKTVFYNEEIAAKGKVIYEELG